MLLPWHLPQWQQLEWAKQQNRLPHALLLTGPAGLGKMQFAEHFASSLFCECAVNNMPCHPCRLITARTHPDMLWVAPEKSGHAIKVDHVRQVGDFVAQSSFQGDKRVVVICPADGMNHHAANALLKTLEEPAPGTILILISHQHTRLPATILSRCQQIQFNKPSFVDGLNWLMNEAKISADEAELFLKLAHGAPLAALQLQQTDIIAIREHLFANLARSSFEPLALAKHLQEYELITTIDLLLDILMDIAKVNLGHHGIVNADYAQVLEKIAKQIPLPRLTAFTHYLQHIRQQVDAGVNLNKQLLLETIFIHWSNHLSCI